MSETLVNGSLSREPVVILISGKCYDGAGRGPKMWMAGEELSGIVMGKDGFRQGLQQ